MLIIITSYDKWRRGREREAGRVVTVRRNQGGEKDSHSCLLWDFGRSFCHFALLSLHLCRRQVRSFSRSRDATCESSPMSETHSLLRRAPPRMNWNLGRAMNLFTRRLKIEASDLTPVWNFSSSSEISSYFFACFFFFFSF